MNTESNYYDLNYYEVFATVWESAGCFGCFDTLDETKAECEKVAQAGHKNIVIQKVQDGWPVEEATYPSCRFYKVDKPAWELLTETEE